ncbi:MAG: hypothetical protein KJO80_11600, partial [Gammaproteobacteria bacterium]|nr:hypothetical protein [Gammaproteobacteria bacterium]
MALTFTGLCNHAKVFSQGGRLQTGKETEASGKNRNRNPTVNYWPAGKQPIHELLAQYAADDSCST